MCFWYEKQERSIRVEGTTERLSKEESQVYFDTRPVGSRLGAWASPQSSVLEGREQLDGYMSDIKAKFADTEQIPVPDFWGGLRIIPERVEFWSGRNNRLHDRFAMTRKDDAWTLERLSP